MGGHEHPGALLMRHRAQQRRYLARRLRVEVASRLVGGKEAWLMRQGAGQRHPLLLAARKLQSAMMRPRSQANTLQRHPRSAPSLRCRKLAQPQHHLHILLRREQREEVRVLKEDAGCLAPQPRALGLAALLRAAADGAQPRAAEKGITLVTQGPASCALEGDAHLLRRAVENLLDNALRHTPIGGHISVCWERATVGWRFLVADSGPGIAPADLPRIFDPLYRGEASRNRGAGGAGLGLAIARRILQAHGGDLTAESHPGGGAQLAGTLPASGENAVWQ
jgi:signal transduction histidine kinase